SCSGPWYGVAGAQQARHFTMRLLRAGQRGTRPLNCGVRRQSWFAGSSWRHRMSSATKTARKPLIIAPHEGRTYDMGRMRATFVADDAQTASKYSISEWWLESYTQGPGVHAHEDDHVFYVIEGTLSVQIAGEWFDAERGSYVVIPGETLHDFENRGLARC